MQQIKKVDVYQTSKVVAIIYSFLTAIFCIPAGIVYFIVSVIDGFNMNALFAILIILAPIGYGIFTFLMVAIGCAGYNFVAKKFGGIGIELG